MNDRLNAAVAALLARCEAIDGSTWHANGDPSPGGYIATAEVWELLAPPGGQPVGTFSEEVARFTASVNARVAEQRGGDAGQVPATPRAATKERRPATAVQLSGGRGTDLTATYTGLTGTLRLDWDNGEATGEFHGDELLKLRDWITATYGETS